MDCNILADFRRSLYTCFRQAGDALMNLADALLSETPAQSLVELSLSPFFTRQWPSVYEALQDANIDRAALLKLFVEYAPIPAFPQRLVLGGDASSILRVQSKTAKDRTYVHASNLPEGTKPVRPGWQFSTVSVLPQLNSSWTYVLENRRIPSSATQATVMAEQLAQILGLLAEHPGLCARRALWLGDGYYGSYTFLELIADLPCDVLVRFAKNRVLYREPAPQECRRGHPTWHGARFACKDASTHATPDACWEGLDERGQRLEVACWHRLHFKKARHVLLSVMRVTRHGAQDTKRDPKVSWFVFRGLELPQLASIPALYARRYSLEHGYRVDKQDLLWETPRLRTPEAFQHWTDLVACVRNQLFLARDLAGEMRQPWESSQRASTPSQVRRCMGRIMAELGTPARVCRPRGNSPGWPVGRARTAAPTYAVVYKASAKAQTGAKRRRKRPAPVAAAA
jgi:DDE superfamily endonuclease